jgi:undecaprenyl-diphosphatase
MQILDFIQNHISNDFFDTVMPIITHLGDYGIIWLLSAVFFIITKKYRIAGIAILTALLLCIIIGNLTIKPIIARERPFTANTEMELLIAAPSDYSFPSGHTMASFAAAIVIFRAKKRIGIFALVLASLIAFSRLYLYVHYPSDVFVGAVMGIGFGLLAYFITLLILKKFGKKSRESYQHDADENKEQHKSKL